VNPKFIDTLHKKLTQSFLPCTLIFNVVKLLKTELALILMLLISTCAASSENITADNNTASINASNTSTNLDHFGVPLAPPMWLANFLLVYFLNPENASYMPAYRAPIPQEVYKCLAENPEGCPYADMAQYFDEQALQSGGNRNNNSSWPSYCQTDPKWQALAPPEYRQPVQGNVRSNCAPDAPCLLFNQLAKGPLEAMAIECGCEDKVKRLFNETPLIEFFEEALPCQQTAAPSCIVEATCLCNSSQSNNCCAASIATQ
jgi:hypothetical protein